MNRRLIAFAAVMLATSIFGGSKTYADGVPQIINYQGRIRNSDGSPVADGNKTITFRIYDSESGGNTIWSQVMNDVRILGGLFQVLLGDGTPIADSVFPYGTDRWLGVQVENDSELTPRQKIASVPFAFTANKSKTADNAATANTAITVVDGAITTSKVADSAINNAKISDVDWSKVTNRPTSMPPSGPAGGALTGSYPNPQIAPGAIQLPAPEPWKTIPAYGSKYCKDMNGTVRVRPCQANNGGQLPPGYRPNTKLRFTFAYYHTTNGWTPYDVYINPDGWIIASDGFTDEQVEISFRADQ